MFFLNYIVIPLVLIIMIFLIRSYARHKNNIPGLLFAEALRNENSGHYEEAVITYKNALANITPSAFRKN